MPVSLEQDGVAIRIRLQGEINISCAQELKGLLVEGLKPDTEVHVLLTEATDLGVTVVQLLLAARREAKASGVEFAFEGRLPEPVTASLAEAGLETFVETHEPNQGGVDPCTMQ